jgi:steroid 5-alpha reductase family enzyme
MKPIFIAIAFIVVYGTAASLDSVDFAGIPVMALGIAVAVIAQWIAFIPAYRYQTERYYDLMGSVSFVAITLFALTVTARFDTRAVILSALICLWALRLGSFLFTRIHQDGGDDRFAKIKPDAKRFFLTWTLQGLWVAITTSAAIAAITSTEMREMSWLDANALSLWCVGFAIEVIADKQKRSFRKQHGKDAFITTGLWSISRHPNYFGEILLWVGVTLLAVPALQGWSYITLLSPVFVTLLLTRMSGIPLLEKKAEAKWGNDPNYQAYKKRTPLLVPFT